jgi:hypothetical protein
MALLAVSLLVAGCAGSTMPVLEAPVSQSSHRPLTVAELDRITAGDARASGDTSAAAIGGITDSLALSDNTSLTGGGPIAGAPFATYAASLDQGVANGAATAQANGSGSIFAGLGAAGAGAVATAAASGVGPRAQAQITFQLYGVGTANGTNLMFGSAGAAACCGPAADSQATLTPSASGPYVRSLQMTRINPLVGISQDTIDVATVSSQLPIIEPSRVAAAVASPLR